MNEDTIYTAIIQALARGYCHDENTGKVVDPILIEAMAREIVLILPLDKPDA